LGGQGNTDIATGSLNNIWRYNIADGIWGLWSSPPILVNQIGIYGTKGVESTTNVPGTRSVSSAWYDNSGNIWLFGGNGYSAIPGMGAGPLNDLWRYNIARHQWTWMSGTTSSTATLGVYGTQGIESTTNVPGSRSASSTWYDGQGNLWLFGGLSGSQFDGGDLWKYNIRSNQWTWVSGPQETISVTGPSPLYYVKGIPSVNNQPVSAYASAVYDGNNAWVFGGTYGAVNSGSSNVLWKLFTY